MSVAVAGKTQQRDRTISTKWEASTSSEAELGRMETHAVKLEVSHSRERKCYHVGLYRVSLVDGYGDGYRMERWQFLYGLDNVPTAITLLTEPTSRYSSNRLEQLHNLYRTLVEDGLNGFPQATLAPDTVEWAKEWIA